MHKILCIYASPLMCMAQYKLRESAVQGRGRAGLWANDKQVVEVEQAIMPYPMLLQFPPVQI